MKIQLNKKVSVIAAGAAMMVSAITYAAPPTYHEEVVYFSDSSYSTTVGEKVTTCSGFTLLEGQVTRYAKVLYREAC